MGSTPTSFLPFGDMIVDVVMEDYEGRDGQFIPASTRSTPQYVAERLIPCVFYSEFATHAAEYYGVFLTGAK